MGMPMQCFSIEELKSLDERQLELLRFAIEREIRNSEEIKAILRARFKPMYDQLVAQEYQK